VIIFEFLRTKLLQQKCCNTVPLFVIRDWLLLLFGFFVIVIVF